VHTRSSRILLIDQDDVQRDEISDALSDAGYRVHAESNGRQLSKALAGFHPDAVIVGAADRVGPSGLGITRFVRASAGVAVLVTAPSDDLPLRLSAFEAGADDVVTTPLELTELLARLRAILLRAGRADSETWEFADILVHEPSRSASRGGHPLELTPTQFELLLELGRHPGRVVSKRHLLATVWAGGSSSHNLVEAHVSALRRALERHGPPVIATIRGFGYRLEHPMPHNGFHPTPNGLVTHSDAMQVSGRGA
jgi:two-component system, OmpR family, response regulator